MANAVDVFARAAVDPDPNVALAAADAALAAFVVGVETPASRRGRRGPALIRGVGTRVARDRGWFVSRRISRSSRTDARRAPPPPRSARWPSTRARNAPGRRWRWRRRVPQTDDGTPESFRRDRRSRRTCGARRSARSPPSRRGSTAPSPSPLVARVHSSEDAPRWSKINAHRRSPSTGAANPRANVPLDASCAHALDALLRRVGVFPEGLPSSFGTTHRVA